jgi:L-threonylcarbamoyladenylate synthase
MSAIVSLDILQAARLLHSGALVAIPTETVYGLAANALNADAVVRIFETKNRPVFDPLIVHVKDAAEVEKFAQKVPEHARLLIDKFWPGPLTLVLKKSRLIPDIVTSGLDTVGLRMPNHPLTLQLLRETGFPLAAPSANPFGYISPTSAQHVVDQLGEKIPLILDGGPCTVGVESTIVDCSGSVPIVRRLGGISMEALAEVVGEIELLNHDENTPNAPGMLLSHYAPRKKMFLGNIHDLLHEYPNNVSILSFKDQYYNFNNIRLSESGDLHEAARNLFTALRKLDADSSDVIIAESVPDYGIGRAINDRLRRAAHGK